MFFVGPQPWAASHVTALTIPNIVFHVKDIVRIPVVCSFCSSKTWRNLTVILHPVANVNRNINPFGCNRGKSSVDGQCVALNARQ